MSTKEQSSPASQEWEQRFDAVARLFREAHEKVDTDPLSAAVRARQAIEHIADYIHLRELGPAARNDILDAKLKRIDAKLVFPRMVSTHFGTVQIHANSIIHAGSMAADPDPSLLKPCLGSLTIVVEWFFRDYLKRQPPALGQAVVKPAVSPPPPPVDATPINSTSTLMNYGTRFGTGIGEFIPVWRSTATPSTLRLEADGDASQSCSFKIEDPARVYYIGRTEHRSNGTANDFALPKAWNSISRDQGTLTTEDGSIVLTNTSNNSNAFVRGEVVPKGTARALRHGDGVQLGRCVGTFSDGRYYASAPSTAIDARTGLLSRLGMVTEMSGYLATGKSRTLLVIRCPEGSATAADVRDPERMAALVATAVHRHEPSYPVARIGMDVAILLPPDASTIELADVADRAAGTRCTSGFLTLTGPADQAMPRLEACIGALSRMAIAGREPVGPEDITRYALVPISIDAFAAHAQPLFDVGGGAILFALDDLERLHHLAPQAIPVLELELVEMLGARMGPRDIVSFAGPGLLLFGTPGDVDRFAQELSVAWHGRGPVTANSLEIDRSLSAHLLAATELERIGERARLLAHGGNGALGASSLPSPLALAARSIEEARDPVARVRALVDAAELAWRMLAYVLLANARGQVSSSADNDDDAWPAPWRAVARKAVEVQQGQRTRINELAALARSAEPGNPLAGAMDIIAGVAQLLTAPKLDAPAIERSLPRTEKAVREIFGALGPLRGWTLVGIDQADIVDPHTFAQRIEYIDYTGPSTRGSPQRVTVTGFLPLGRFVYFVRWNEGLAIALEPYIRRVRNETIDDTDLFLVKKPIVEAGSHPYRSATTALEIDLPVTAKQIGGTR